MRRRYSRPDRGRRGTVVGCRGERRRGLPQRPAQPAAASRAETPLRAVAGFVADVGMHEPLVWFAPDSLLERAGFEPSVPGESGFGFAREGPNVRISSLQRRVERSPFPRPGHLREPADNDDCARRGASCAAHTVTQSDDGQSVAAARRQKTTPRGIAPVRSAGCG
jgi:hypothetical protein